MSEEIPNNQEQEQQEKQKAGPSSDSTTVASNSSNVENIDLNTIISLCMDIVKNTGNTSSSSLKRPIRPAGAYMNEIKKKKAKSDDDSDPENMEHNDDNVSIRVDSDVESLLTQNDQGEIQNEETEIFDELESPPRAKSGSPVNEKLAEKIIQRWTIENNKKRDIVKPLIDKYLLPENLQILTIPPMPKQILTMSTFDDKAKRNERKLYEMQRHTMCATIALCHLAQNILDDERKDVASKMFKSTRESSLFVAKGCLDAITFLSSVNSDLNERRKENVRPALKQDVKSICNSDKKPSPKSLFGDEDFAKLIKDTKEFSRLNISNDYNNKYLHSNKRKPTSTTYKKPFLSQGRNQNHKKRQHYKK